MHTAQYVRFTSLPMTFWDNVNVPWGLYEFFVTFEAHWIKVEFGQWNVKLMKLENLCICRYLFFLRMMEGHLDGSHL